MSDIAGAGDDTTDNSKAARARSNNHEGEWTYPIWCGCVLRLKRVLVLWSRGGENERWCYGRCECGGVVQVGFDGNDRGAGSENDG